MLSFYLHTSISTHYITVHLYLHGILCKQNSSRLSLFNIVVDISLFKYLSRIVSALGV